MFLSLFGMLFKSGGKKGRKWGKGGKNGEREEKRLNLKKEGVVKKGKCGRKRRFCCKEAVKIGHGKAFKINYKIHPCKLQNK